MWTKVEQGVPQGSVLGPLLFLLYINDLPNAISHKAIPILFAGDTSILITGHNLLTLQDDPNATFGQISKWFQVNSLSLNISETYFIQFASKSSNYLDININYENNYISKVNDAKFLGLYINNTLSWKIHIDKILPKLCSAYFAMRSVKPYLSQQTLLFIYYSYFHSIMSYCKIFWGHSSPSLRVFRLQKRIIRIMTGSRSRDLCKKTVYQSKTSVTPFSVYFSLLRFVMKNRIIHYK
jgi:hypothetical protein